MPDWLAIGIGVFALGFAAGAWLAERRWSSNANVPQRICYKGRLYKVRFDDADNRSA